MQPVTKLSDVFGVFGSVPPAVHFPLSRQMGGISLSIGDYGMTLIVFEEYFVKMSAANPPVYLNFKNKTKT
jgi:hypothetical protein